MIYICVCIYAHTIEYYSAIKKWGNPTICNNMVGSWRYYAKWNNPDRERQILCDLTFKWNLKKQRDKQTNKKQETHRKRDQTYGYQRQRAGEGKLKDGGQKKKKHVKDSKKYPNTEENET